MGGACARRMLRGRHDAAAGDCAAETSGGGRKVRASNINSRRGESALFSLQPLLRHPRARPEGRTFRRSDRRRGREPAGRSRHLSRSDLRLWSSDDAGRRVPGSSSTGSGSCACSPRARPGGVDADMIRKVPPPGDAARPNRRAFKARTGPPVGGANGKRPRGAGFRRIRSLQCTDRAEARRPAPFPPVLLPQAAKSHAWSHPLGKRRWKPPGKES